MTRKFSEKVFMFWFKKSLFPFMFFIGFNFITTWIFIETECCYPLLAFHFLLVREWVYSCFSLTWRGQKKTKTKWAGLPWPVWAFPSWVLMHKLKHPEYSFVNSKHPEYSCVNINILSTYVQTLTTRGLLESLTAGVLI